MAEKPPEPKKEEKKPDPPKPEPKKEEKKPDPPKKEDPPKRDFSSVLNNVLKDKPAEKPEPPAAPSKQINAAKDRETRVPTPGTGQDATLSPGEEDALRRQFAACWNVDVGAKGVQEMSAEFRVFFNPQMEVIDSQFIKGSGNLSDPRFRSFAESAKRAIDNPRCKRLDLPAEKYGNQGTIVINFSPRDMF
ncbi:hypothetical protein [Aerophototrophica crusticola]|uniref:hypothetical protein n=1 Tax=Aerophototrophica crusticola TaxID=1709002 RepID=UPI00385007AC